MTREALRVQRDDKVLQLPIDSPDQRKVDIKVLVQPAAERPAKGFGLKPLHEHFSVGCRWLLV